MGSGVRRLALLAVAIASSTTFCSRPDEKVVQVNDRQVTLTTARLRVADVLASAGIATRPGMLRSIVTGRLLQPNGNPPQVQVDGKPATLETRIQDRARLTTFDGVDTIEPVDMRDVVAPLAGGGPPVEETLWFSGRPSRERLWVGRTSGEVVTRLVVEPEIPSRPATGKVVALTFDDGPDPRFTPAVLEILRQERVPATFCVIGSQGRKHPHIVRAETNAGHAHCNHTVEHRVLPGRDAAYIYGQVAGGSEFLTSVDDVAPKLFRAPEGRVTPEVIRMANAQGMRVLRWSIDSGDYLRSPPDVIVSRVLSTVKPGAVILLHDGGGDRSNTIAALRPLISGLKAQGYSFATPAQMAP